MRRSEKDPGKTKINTRIRQRENVPDTLQSRHDNSVDMCVDKVTKEVGTDVGKTVQLRVRINVRTLHWIYRCSDILAIWIMCETTVCLLYACICLRACVY